MDVVDVKGKEMYAMSLQHTFWPIVILQEILSVFKHLA